MLCLGNEFMELCFLIFVHNRGTFEGRAVLAQEAQIFISVILISI